MVGYQPEAIPTPSPKRYLEMSGDIFRCHNWGSDTGIQWVEVRQAATHPTMQQTVPYNKKRSGLKCQGH